VSTEELQLALLELGLTPNKLADEFQYNHAERELLRRCVAGLAVPPPSLVRGIDNLLWQQGWLACPANPG
jgi:hypothetical protein